MQSQATAFLQDSSNILLVHSSPQAETPPSQAHQEALWRSLGKALTGRIGVVPPLKLQAGESLKLPEASSLKLPQVPQASPSRCLFSRADAIKCLCHLSRAVATSDFKPVWSFSGVSLAALS
ncbi:hypothetical protein C8R45DRAFT_1078404 [Mycena sanguinolenta]|nr:hypothetical protein C8R45DRAFT_1078404 [Mycena sanguinolenta]